VEYVHSSIIFFFSYDPIPWVPGQGDLINDDLKSPRKTGIVYMYLKLCPKYPPKITKIPAYFGHWSGLFRTLLHFLDQILVQLLLSHLSVMSFFEMGSLVGIAVLLFPWNFFALQENQPEPTHHIISKTLLYLIILTVVRPCLTSILTTLPQASKLHTTAIAMRGGANNAIG
jgi:hypothetical protein